MKIAEGLLIQRDIAEEVARLKSLAKTESWEYRVTDPGAKWLPTFNLEENHQKVLGIDKKMRRLSRAINATNNMQEILGIQDTDYQEWL